MSLREGTLFVIGFSIVGIVVLTQLTWFRIEHFTNAFHSLYGVLGPIVTFAVLAFFGILLCLNPGESKLR